MRFGLHRSLIFWAGLLTTIFIGWAARDSWGHASGVRAGSHLIFSVCGGVVVMQNDYAAGPSFWEASREDAPVVRKVLESPFFLRGKEEDGPGSLHLEDSWTFSDLYAHVMSFQPRGDWLLYLPYWLLWMVMAVVWVGLLVCRQRRGREAVVMALETES